MKRVYAAQDRIHKQLNTPEGAKVTDSFFKALSAAVRHPPNRSLMVQFAAASTTLNAADSIGIMKWILTLNPVASRDQMGACPEVMKCLVRCNVAVDLPHEMAAMREKFDEFLVQALMQIAIQVLPCFCMCPARQHYNNSLVAMMQF